MKFRHRQYARYRNSSEDELAEETRNSPNLVLRPGDVRRTCFDVQLDVDVRIRMSTSGSGRADVQCTFYVR